MGQTPPQFGSEWWDGQRRGGIGSTFSDDANSHNRGRGVASPSSCFIAYSIHLWPLSNRRVSHVQIVTRHYSQGHPHIGDAMATQNSEQCRDNVLHENLSEAS
jgi:hypothetical protein